LKSVTQHSKLYKWLLDLHIAHWEPDDDREDPYLLNRETDPDSLLANFIYEVMKGIAVREKPENNQSYCSCCNDICQYHEHESKEEWEASMLT
jgi:hypothetical protein